MRFALLPIMKKPKKSARKRSPSKKKHEKNDGALLGPPARETVWMPTDRELATEEELRAYTSSSPALTGGDVDADWRRADSVGEEAVGGSVATPDQDVVDDLGRALGVPRAPDEAFRPSSEILESRDRRRAEQED
jgi:Family of unknown function (DUF6335)